MVDENKVSLLEIFERMYRERLEEAGDRTDPVCVDIDGQVAIEGWVRDEPEGAPQRRVRVHVSDEQMCLVVLPKAVAKAYGLQPCNSPYSLCIWDPVTGRIRCTATY